MSEFIQFPPQQLPFTKKTVSWRKKHLDWADSKSLFNYSLVRKSVIHKKINYDLVAGKLHMKDIELILNPENIQANYIPDKIQHYPIINSKVNILKGEESERIFDYRVIITNPEAVSSIEALKKEEMLQRAQEWASNMELSEEESQQALERIGYYYNYEYQDYREIRANALINHYNREYNFNALFNDGFMDGMICGEEIYQCDIIGGEPVIERLDPLKVRVFKSGYSNKIEDADVIVIEDYWSPGKVIDVYGEYLKPKDFDYLEKLPDHIGAANKDSRSNIDERYGFVNMDISGDELTSQEGFFLDPLNTIDGLYNNRMPNDLYGNVRVLRVYWKSKRKIKKIKSYDPQTGEEIFTFYPENYIPDITLGEEEVTSFYINEAWEGTKIGSDIYVNMRPRVIQYNRMSNPSRCHFGIVGSIYNINEDKPFSLVDMLKPFNYLYDVVHDRLNKLLAKNWGKIIQLDLAKVPKGWDIDKWFYYAKTNNIAVIDSFKEGSGAASGKLVGGLNNNTSGVIDADWGNNIQQYINLLEFIKLEASECVGITKQREGQISNRETVGGVERATLQSSYITKWLFTRHDDVKKRALEVFLETAKIALRGKSKKFTYILSDASEKIMTIDGDEFAECDYGLVVDNSNTANELNQKLDSLAQAGIQNNLLTFSTVMKLYSSRSLSEKYRLVEKEEQAAMERSQQQQQQQMEAEQQQLQQNAEMEQAKMEHEENMNTTNNEAKILIAQINASAKLNDGIEEPEYSEESKANLLEKIREFDATHKLNQQRLEFDKSKAKTDAELKRLQINKSKVSKS
jgi:hypothetical protein